MKRVKTRTLKLDSSVETLPNFSILELYDCGCGPRLEVLLPVVVQEDRK